VLPNDAACPLIFPRLSDPRSTFSTKFSPPVWYASSIVWKAAIKDDPESCSNGMIRRCDHEHPP
jgi:hypothetical protein